MSEVDYTRVIADLEAKRDRILAAIVAIRELAGMEAAPVSEPTASDTTKAYAGLSVAKATEIYLRAQGKAKSSPEIGRALKRGGYKTETQGSFTNIVYSRLYTMAKDGKVFVRVGKGPQAKWGLKEWQRGREEQLRVISSA